MKVIWITGLSGSGKSTVKKVTEVLRKNGEKVIYLDGDELRNIFKTNNLNINNYSREKKIRTCYAILLPMSSYC